MDAPRITLASSLHKKRMPRAMSAGLGHFAKSALGMAFLLASVSMILGRTEFTRTPVPLRSAAREYIIAIAAAFEAAYAAAPAVAPSPALAATLTIAPSPCLKIAGTTARANAQLERRLRESIRSRHFESCSQNFFPALYPPTVFTSTSIRP